MFVLVGFFVLSSYSIIMGWTGRLLLDSLRGTVPSDTAAYFSRISTGISLIPFHLVSMALTVLVVYAGIRGGIERAAKVLMPVLLLLLVALAGWAATLSGASEGYAFYLRPSVRELLNADVIAAAAGQAFFSLSLGMGGLITLASYMEHRRGNLAGQAGAIAFADTTVAIVGGLVVFPVIYHFGLQAQVGASPIGTLFITLPGAFNALETGGTLIASVFFFALYIAALTSATVMLEVVVASIIDVWNWPRHRTTVLAGCTIALVGIPGALNTNWLAFVDKLVGEVFLVLGGLLTAILTGWVWSRGAGQELAEGFGHRRLIISWLWLIRAIIPLVLLVVLYITLTQAIPVLRALLP
jgi:NSS family neurotransmitter:Na+ symporter